MPVPAPPAAEVPAPAPVPPVTVPAPEPPEPPHYAEKVYREDGTFWLPPVGASWRETARYLFPHAHDLLREDQQLLTAISQRVPIGRWQTPERITPEIAEKLTMIYRRIAGLPT